MRKHVAVVGAGPSGLAAALELAASADVTLIDRLPTTGGMTGWEDAAVRRLTVDCSQAGVELLLGATALRWQDGRLLTAMPGSIRWLSFDHVVIATGCRPATRAELRLSGSRPAGVLSALVAIHLIEAGVSLGRRAVVVGVTAWGERAAHHLHAQGSHVSVVAPEGATRPPLADATRPLPADAARPPWADAARPPWADAARPPWADAWWPGWEAVAVTGQARVTRLIVERGAARLSIPCEAIVLAADPRPLRNVDGALNAAADVSFTQEPELDTSAKVARSTAMARGLAATLKGVTA